MTGSNWRFHPQGRSRQAKRIGHLKAMSFEAACMRNTDVSRFRRAEVATSSDFVAAQIPQKAFGKPASFQHTIRGMFLFDLAGESEFLPIDRAHPDIVRAFAMAVEHTARSAQKNSNLRAVVAAHVKMLRELDFALELEQTFADPAPNKIRGSVYRYFHELVEGFRFDVKPRDV